MEILEIVEQKLKYLNYADTTRKVYTHYVHVFLKFVKKPISQVTADDYTMFLTEYQYSSVSQQNQIVNALKFFYEKVLNRKYNKVSFERPRKEQKLPKVIDRELLISSIENIQNVKHKAILSLAYSTGIRVSEVINLKITDVDSSRMVVLVRQSKNNKDRIVPLSKNLLELLRNYYKVYKPKEYLFNGQFANQYTASSCNQLVKKYIGKQYHFHMLRHSCFTTLLESGVDIRLIQKLAGHSSSKTTEVYTHVSKTLLCSIPLPL